MRGQASKFRLGMLGDKRFLDLAIIVLILVLCFQAWQYLSPEAPELRPYLSVSLTSEPSSIDHTLLFALSEECPVCKNATDKFRQLAKHARSSGVRTIAVLPESPESSAVEWLRSEKIPFDRIMSQEELGIQLQLVPMVAILQDNQVTEFIWAGDPTPEELRQIAEALECLTLRDQGCSALSNVETVTSFKKRINGNRPEDLYVLVLSDEPSLIRGREVRLTLENLEARAPKEFPRGKPIAISCAGVSFADCAASLKVLQGLAFNEVKIIL